MHLEGRGWRHELDLQGVMEDACMQAVRQVEPWRHEAFSGSQPQHRAQQSLPSLLNPLFPKKAGRSAQVYQNRHLRCPGPCPLTSEPVHYTNAEERHYLPLNIRLGISLAGPETACSACK